MEKLTELLYGFLLAFTFHFFVQVGLFVSKGEEKIYYFSQIDTYMKTYNTGFYEPHDYYIYFSKDSTFKQEDYVVVDGLENINFIIEPSEKNNIYIIRENSDVYVIKESNFKFDVKRGVIENNIYRKLEMKDYYGHGFGYVITRDSLFFSQNNFRIRMLAYIDSIELEYLDNSANNESFIRAIPISTKNR